MQSKSSFQYDPVISHFLSEIVYNAMQLEEEGTEDEEAEEEEADDSYYDDDQGSESEDEGYEYSNMGFASGRKADQVHATRHFHDQLGGEWHITDTQLDTFKSKN